MPARLPLVVLSVGLWGAGLSAAGPTARVVASHGYTQAIELEFGKTRAVLCPQVGGRVLEFGLLRRVHPLLSARLATLGHPLGGLALLAFGMPAAVPFALLHGAGNGIMTIANGTLPLAVFGSQGYGARQGWLSLPSLVLQSFAPWLFGLVLARSVSAALLLSASLCMAAFAALLALRMPVRSSVHASAAGPRS